MALLTRTLIALPFIGAGAQAWRNPEGHREAVSRVIGLAGKLPIDTRVEWDKLPIDTITKATGAAMVGCGVMLMIGRCKRAAATGLAALQIPITLARSPFWQQEGEQKAKSVTDVVVSAGLIGGVWAAAASKRTAGGD